MAIVIIASLIIIAGLVIGFIRFYISQRNKWSAGLSSLHELEKKVAVHEDRYSRVVGEIDKKLLEYQTTEQERILGELEELQTIYNEKKIVYDIELENKRREFEEEAARLKKSQAAIIGTYRRQEEVRQEKDFYRLCLSLDSLEDIKLLEPIAAKLSQPEILRKLLWATYFKPAFDSMTGRVLKNGDYCGIYKITSLRSGRAYIGQSTSVKNRWAEHVKSALEIGTIARTQLYTAMKEEGIENFTFEVVEECKKEELNAREKYYISFYDTNNFGLNLTKGGS